MKIKICGMREAANLLAVADFDPDFLGFIFYPKSARYVGDSLDPAQVRSLPAAIAKVGVFVDADLAEVQATNCAYTLDYVQLHGHETPAQCEELGEAGLLVMKAFSVGEKVDFNALLPYVPHCDYFLFDAKGAAPGGNGTVFNWKLLLKYNLPVPYFLAGGLGLEHAAELASLRLPGLAGVDLNSSFETAPGVKDASRVGQMLAALSSKRGN